MGRVARKTNPAYDAEHRRLRAKLLPLAYGQRCPYCPKLMLRGQALDLDHATSLVLGLPDDGRRRMAHAHCNRRHGALLQARLRRARRSRQEPLVNSRSW